MRNRGRPVPFPVALTLALAATVRAPDVCAQTAAETASRRFLLQQAEDARRHGDHPRALDLAQRAGTIQMTPSVRLFIAEEQHAVGRVADALGNAEICARDAQREGDRQSHVQRRCRQLQGELQSRVGMLVVHPPSPAPEGLQVTVRGQPLSAALYDVPAAVDPGAVEIVARAPGRTPFTQTVTAPAGGSVEVRLALAEEAATPPPVTAPTPQGNVPSSMPQTAMVAPRPADPGQGSGPGPAPAPRVGPGPWVLVGVGGGLVVGGFVMLGLRASALQGCNVQVVDGALTAVCGTAAERDRAQQAPLALYTWGGIAAASVGAALVIAGGAWYGVARAQSERRAYAVTVVPSLDGGSLVIGGRW